MRKTYSLEWHIPWPEDWPMEKKLRAAAKIIEYIHKGTFYDVTSRHQVVEADIMQINGNSDPVIRMRLE